MKMRKRIIAFLLLFVIGVFALVACGDGETNDNTDPKPVVGDAIISEGKELVIVYGSGFYTEDQINDLKTSVGEVTGVDPLIMNSSSNKIGTEIVVGSTTREISVAAEKRLNSALKRAIRAAEDEDIAEEDLAAYTIYSDGESIAIVWTSDYGAAPALEYFKENFVFEDLALEEGYSKSVVFSVTAYLEERANKMKDAAWAELAAQLPADKSEEIVEALKTLYSLYSPDVVDWMANLYDPGVGGFYFSNSARDNEGFLPDIETTYGIFGFMEASGMMEMYGNDWDAAVPDWMSDAVCDWIYNLQDEDTYFYHPQWSKEYIDANDKQSRKTRDRGSASTTLGKFGRTPKYEITGLSANLTGGMGTDSAVAVSKVVAVSDMMDKYATLEAFQAYVATMDAELKSMSDADKAYWFYAKGNEFQSITSYLPADVKVAVIEFFDKYQCPETGMWSENLYYNSTNALHKIGAVYNSIGAPMKYTDKMIESTLTILLWTPEESPAGAGVDIYNALSCFTYIYENVRNYGEGTEAEREATVAAYKARVYEEAVTITQYSFDQMARFAYPDGSFGYSPNNRGTGGTAQGCPVAVAGTKEGDVNGTYIASLDIIDHTMGMLDLTEYTVPLFTEQERYRFFKLAEDLGPVIKAGGEVVESVVIDFEDSENETDIPAEISMNQRDSEVYIRTNKDKDDDHEMVVVASNWYASSATNSKRNANFTIAAGSVAENASVGVIEFTISVDDAATSDFYVRFTNNTKGNIITYTVATVKSGAYSYVDIRDPVNKSLGVKLYCGGGDEMHVRLELYKNQSATKAYIDGKLLGVQKNLANADINFESAMFEFHGGSNMTAVFDDIKVEKDNIPYVEETTVAPPTYPVPKLGRPSYDFEDCTVGVEKYPKDFTVTKNYGTADIIRGETGKALNLFGGGTGLQANPNFSIINYDVVEGGELQVFQTDILIDSVPVKEDKWISLAKLQFYNAGGTEVLQLLIQTYTVDGVKHIRIVDNADSNKNTDSAVVLATLKEGVNTEFKIEYVPSEKRVKIYVDGTLTGSCTSKNVKDKDFATFKFSINSAQALDVTFDNIGLTRQALPE